MQIEINTFIQENLKKLTNKNFSKKYISQFIIPIINKINNSKDNKFIIAGSQGAGKSTLAKIFKLVLEKAYKKKVMLLSIDDYYLSKNKRKKLSKNIHPLLITRGVPGTHDIVALKNDIINFQKKPNSSITRKMLDSIDHRGPDQKIIANNNFSSERAYNNFDCTRLSQSPTEKSVGEISKCLKLKSFLKI